MVERVMRQSTAIPEPSFWLVRSGDAKIDCIIAGARCSENGGSGDGEKTTEAFSLESQVVFLRVGCGAAVCAEKCCWSRASYGATERTRLLRPNSKEAAHGPANVKWYTLWSLGSAYSDLGDAVSCASESKCAVRAGACA